MTNDLISRQDAIDAFMAEHPDGKDSMRISWALNVLDGIPSAQRTGEWLRYGEDGNPNEEDTVFWQCDQCLETYTGRTTRIPNYCPNCGADMRGENNETD